MSIYIFTPTGAGGSQDWQSTLSVSSTLGQNNIIDVNNYNFSFTGFNNYNLIGNKVTIGDTSIDGYISFYQISGTYAFSMYTAGGDPNYITIIGGTGQYYFGDWQGIGNQTYFTIQDSVKSCYFQTNDFTIGEIDTGSGLIILNGTGFYSLIAPAMPQGHLKIVLNGQIRYIALTG